VLVTPDPGVEVGEIEQFALVGGVGVHRLHATPGVRQRCSG
jgi:hypothetical protein